MVKTQTTIPIEGNTYQVKFPTVGEYLDIESMKSSLSDGRYSDMVRSGLRSAYFATDLIDAISHFWVLIPDLRTDLQVKSYLELDPFLAKKLVTAYKKSFLPWYNELMDLLLKEETDNIVPEDKTEDKGTGNTEIHL